MPDGERELGFDISFHECVQSLCFGSGSRVLFAIFSFLFLLEWYSFAADNVTNDDDDGDDGDDDDNDDDDDTKIR